MQIGRSDTHTSDICVAINHISGRVDKTACLPR
jgi:hypothetical protein